MKLIVRFCELIGINITAFVVLQYIIDNVKNGELAFGLSIFWVLVHAVISNAHALRDFD